MFMLNLVFFLFSFTKFAQHKIKFRDPPRAPGLILRRGPTGSRVGIASDGPGGGTPRCL